MLNIKLVTFITVANTKNFTKAADLLNITQPAVSQHINGLEEYYQVKLFYKNGKSMDLTEEGIVLYKYALEMQRLSKIMKAALDNKTAIIKKYYVGATLTIGGYVLPKIIGEYRKFQENQDIILYVENTEAVMKRLFDGDIHLGVIEGPFDKGKVNYQKFKDDELVLAVSPFHDFAARASVTIEEVLKERLILREKGSGTRKVFEDRLIKEGYSLEDENIYMEIGNITALISLVESNLGCTIISQEAIKPSLQANTLKIVPIDNFQVMREFNFVYLQLDEFQHQFIDEFIQFCKQGR